DGREAGAAANRRARRQDRSPALPDRAGDDQHVPVASLVRRGGAPRQPTGGVARLRRFQQRAKLVDRFGGKADVGPRQPPDVPTSGREREADLGKAEGHRERRANRGSPRLATIAVEPGRKVDRDDDGSVRARPAPTPPRAYRTPALGRRRI